MLVVVVSFPTLVDAIEHVLRALPNVCIQDCRPLCSADTTHAANLSLQSDVSLTLSKLPSSSRLATRRPSPRIDRGCSSRYKEVISWVAKYITGCDPCCRWGANSLVFSSFAAVRGGPSKRTAYEIVGLRDRKSECVYYV